MTRGPVLAGLVIAALGCKRSTELIAPSSLECPTPDAVVHLGGTDGPHCGGALAAQFGRYALCSCDDLIVVADLFVGNLGGPGKPPPPGSPGGPPPGDGGVPSGHAGGGTGSSNLPADAGGTPGAVGVNGDVLVWGPTNLNGPLVVSGTGGVKLTGGYLVGTVRSDGPVNTRAPVGLAGDLYAAGDVDGPFSIGGTLHAPASAQLGMGATAAAISREDVTVSPPCGCGNGPLIDIAGAVADRAQSNANGRVTFVDEFDDEIDDDATFDWPCGEYYLPALRTSQGASLEFRVHGRVGIFVAGDVRLGNNLIVSLDSGAELDLVVAGSFYTTGRLFGAPKSPAKLRVWVAAPTVSLGDQIQFGAVVYAPSAVLSAGVGLTLNGSYFAQTLTAADDVNIYYDDTAAQAGQTCGVPALDQVP